MDVVFLSGELRSSATLKETRIARHARDSAAARTPANWLAARRERFDLLLTIDYNLGYSVYLRSLPRTPAIVWLRDPRSAEEARIIESTRIPGKREDTPQGLYSFDSRSMARIHNEAQWFGRPLLIRNAGPSPCRAPRSGVWVEPEHVFFLPNDVRLDPDAVVKSKRPTVVFLGRLDPIKRPWMFAELAAFFPHVEFRFLGQSHFSGQGAWNPDNLPANVRLCGHVNEADKTRLLSEAWVVINTSIHEGMPVSILEGLACETPFLSGVSPGYTIAQFGIITGRTDGDGMQGLEAFRQGLDRLLGDDTLRRDMGQRGREWVRTVHNREHFLECFGQAVRHGGRDAMTSISVVIPTRNCRVLLSETIATLMSQTCTDWELIVVDDGSTDDTRRFLEGQRDPRIRFVIRESSNGPSVARNTGLAEARGDLIMFLDHDDLLRPETLYRLSDALRAHPEALAATAACRLYTENVGSLKVYQLGRPHTGIIWRELLFGWWANSGQNLYRTAVIRAIGGYAPHFFDAHDRKMWLDVARRGPVCVLPFVAMEYRQHAGQITQTKYEGVEAQRQKIWAEFIAGLPVRDQREAHSIRRAAELVQRAVESRADRRFARALRLQLRACLAAPWLVTSPVTRRPLWWGIRKCILRVTTA